MRKEDFQITIDDITKISNVVIITGKANSPYYEGKLGDLKVNSIRTNPLYPDRAFLNVISGDIDKIKIGQTLHGE